MSSPDSHASRVRGALVGAFSAVATTTAHAAAGGAIPQSPALVMLALACATVGVALAGIRIEGRRLRMSAIIGALVVAQAVGHIALGVAAEHQHGGPGATPAMMAAHLAGAVVLGVAINAVEHLVAVCTSVLCWLRLFATGAPRALVRITIRTTSGVLAQLILLRSGLGMRAPPRCVALAA